MHGGVMSAAIYGEKKPSSTVRKLKSEEIGSVVREGMKENPIDVCDDSDNEQYSSFDADVLFADSKRKQKKGIKSCDR